MHICTAVEIVYLNRRLCLGVVGVGGWRVFVCVWGLCLGVVGLGASLVCVCWLGVWVGHVCWLVGRVCSWVGGVGRGVVRCWWVGRVGWGVVGCWWVGRVGWGVVGCWWVGRVGWDVFGCWWVGRVGWGVVDAQNMINTVSHLIETKNQQRFWTLFLKEFYKFLSSYRTKIRFPIKSFLTTFITHKRCS